jgi:probable HAF family extracellular repeat protein
MDGSCAAPAAALAAATAYQAVDLGTLGGATSTATAINAVGQVVGYSQKAGGKTHAFLWTRGVMRDLGHLGGGYSEAYGINTAGQVVGHSATSAGEQHAFIWTDGVMKDLGTLGGSNSSATGVDSSGIVVGYSETGKVWPWQTHAVQWKKGTIVDLLHAESWAAGINPVGTRIAGTRPAGPFLWTRGSIVDLKIPGGGAFALSPSGQVVGYGWRDDPINPNEGEEYAFLWEKGVTTNLGTLGGRESFAYGINPLGQVVGGSETSAGKTHAFLWTNGVMVDLGTLGGGSSLAYGINRAGRVVGVARTASGASHATLWKQQ